MSNRDKAEKWKDHFDLAKRVEIAEDAVERLKDEIELLQAEIREWRECAKYEPTMSGGFRFRSWDRSALDRCREKAETRRAQEQANVETRPA